MADPLKVAWLMQILAESVTLLSIDSAIPSAPGGFWLPWPSLLGTFIAILVSPRWAVRYAVVQLTSSDAAALFLLPEFLGEQLRSCRQHH